MVEANINEEIKSNKFSFVSDLTVGTNIILYNKPCLIIDINKQKNNKTDYKIWIVVNEIFQENTMDIILNSNDKVEIPNIKYSFWYLDSIDNEGKVTLKNCLDKQIVKKENLPNEDNLHFKIKREKLKNADKIMVVKLLSYENYSKIYSIHEI